LKVKFLVTPVGLMMGNIESARRLKNALAREGVDVTDDPKAESYDILHVHTPVPPRNFRVVRKAKKQGKPVVMHAHTTAEDSEGTWTGSRVLSGVTGRYLTRFYNLGDLVLAPSEWTRDRLRGRGVRAPINVLSNGVDLERFQFDQARRQRFRSKYGVPDGSKVVYAIGVVCLKKGIEAFPEVAVKLPELRFVWVGKRSILYHPFRIRRAMRNCPRNVQFVHDLEDIVDAHCGCDYYFTPSFAENQGMAVMEAMAVGRPVVARNLPSYEGLLKNEKSALVCTGTEGFVSGLDRLSKNHELADSLVKNALSTVASHDIRKVAKQLVSIYESLLQTPTRSSEVKA
jgi:1,2-diacylglycerol-3-alpha-glucose alpha-1,2-glucosyltransferase